MAYRPLRTIMQVEAPCACILRCFVSILPKVMVRLGETTWPTLCSSPLSPRLWPMNY